MGLRGAGATSLFRPPPGPHVHVKYRLKLPQMRSVLRGQAV